MSPGERRFIAAQPVDARRKLRPRDVCDAPPPVSSRRCGAGCSVGDGIVGWAIPAAGLTFAGAFGTRLVLDFALAYGLGIAFQYFTTAPVRGLELGAGVAAGIKADSISIGRSRWGCLGGWR